MTWSPPPRADPPDIASNTAFFILVLFSVGAAAVFSFLRRFPFYRPRIAKATPFNINIEYSSLHT